MKIRTSIILVFMGLLSFSRLNAEDATTNKLNELDKLPFGLKVVIAPEKVRGHNFTWSYLTSITATNGSVVVEEFGSFEWRKDKWVFSGKPFTSQDFAVWYSCPGAKLVEGRRITSFTWHGGDALSEHRIKWYFIGVKPDGHRVKGEAVVVILPVTDN
jgi:hypothetical protein